METSAEIEALWAQAVRLHEESRYADALDCLHSLEKRLPNHPALLANLGVVYRDNGDLVSAERYLRRVCAVRPNDAAAHFNLALTLLRAGRLREGFREYEWRWRVKQFQEQRREFSQPLWRGEPLNGRRILLHGVSGVEWWSLQAGPAVEQTPDGMVNWRRNGLTSVRRRLLFQHWT